MHMLQLEIGSHLLLALLVIVLAVLVVEWWRFRASGRSR